MVVRRQSSHPTMRAIRPGHALGPEIRARDYSTRAPRYSTPSQDFDWDTALYLACLSLLQLGYHLTPTQLQRIDDHGK